MLTFATVIVCCVAEQLYFIFYFSTEIHVLDQMGKMEKLFLRVFCFIKFTLIFRRVFHFRIFQVKKDSIVYSF